MSRVYSQRRNDPNILMIANNLNTDQARQTVAIYAADWRNSKPGRAAKVIDGLEVHFLFTDGKLANVMWIDPVPAPVGESKFAPAVGPIPGLEA